MRGNLVALATPFKDGKIDKKSFKKLIDFVISMGCDGIVPAGTTGEAATLSMDEHKEVIDLALEYSGKKVSVIAGTGSNSTEEALELTKYAEKAGADYALVISPYYNKPTQEGLYQHFKKIAENTSIPIILYNIPSRTGVNIDVETVLRLSEIKNIVGIKEASGNLKQVSDIISKKRNFIVLSGEDFLTFPIIMLGGVGVISAVANVVPKEMTELTHLALEGKVKEAREIHFKLQKIFSVLFIETNPSPVKFALYKMGVISSPEVRLPLVQVSEKSARIIEETLREYRIIADK